MPMQANPDIVNVTARQLMGMRAGLQDYNDTSYRTWTMMNPRGDWSPFDILHQLNHTFISKPGTHSRVRRGLVHESSPSGLPNLSSLWATFSLILPLPPEKRERERFPPSSTL